VKPEVVAVGRTTDGTFTDPVVVAQSPGAYLGDRFGDYFGAARDPGDPNLVWVAGEVGTAVAGERGWTTAVASIEVTATGAPPPPVLVVAPPAVRAVHATGRAGKSIRLVYRALDDGTGVRTVVTVRTKKTVVFARTTPKSIVHSGELYSVSWRPSKKLRGTLAYCVHSVSATGQLSAPSCSTVVVAEVDVHGLCRGTDLRGERRVRRLAAPQIPKRRRMLEIVDACRAGRRKTHFDPRPRRMLEVESDPQRGIERSEQQLEHAFVAGVLQRDADRAEPVAERVGTACELVEAAEPVTGELRRELEAVGHLLRPPAELILGGKPVARRVQLDRRKPLGIEGEKARRVGACRVEARPPGRVRPARGADRDPR
jgi:hypothetical protein